MSTLASVVCTNVRTRAKDPSFRKTIEAFPSKLVKISRFKFCWVSATRLRLTVAGSEIVTECAY